MRLTAVLLFFLLFSACSKEDQRVLFEIPFRNLDFTIPAGINPFEAQYFTLSNVQTNAKDLISGFGYSEEQVTSIVPVSARIFAPFDNVDFDFVFEVSVRICDAGDTSPNCGSEIFWRQPVPENIGNFIDLIPNELDVMERLMKENVSIQIKLAQLRDTSPQFINARLEMDFEVR
jgi:hypothetical protein